MPSGTFTVADVMDRGLAAIEETDQPAVADGPSETAITARFREIIGNAQLTPELAGLVDAVEIAKDPAATAAAFINAKYAALGGAAGFLGPTASAVSVCPDGIGWFRHFRDGSIYWHPAVGAHECHGAIRAKWASLDWERSSLGYPTSDQMPGTDPAQRGFFNRFQGGMVLWHPAPLPIVVAAASAGRAVTALSAAVNETTSELPPTGPWQPTEIHPPHRLRRPFDAPHSI
jgi:uncharacterized protein with LGFP repeats